MNEPTIGELIKRFSSIVQKVDIQIKLLKQGAAAETDPERKKYLEGAASALTQVNASLREALYK